MPGTLPLRQYDLVLCDIDGCLVSEGQEAFDLRALALVREHNRLAVERGDRPLVTVCSGRPQPFAESMCRLIGNMLIPCVCENGAWVYHPGTNVYELDPAISPAHLEAVGELSRWARLQFGPHGVTQQPGKTASVTLFHRDTAFLRGGVFPAVAAQCEAMRWPFRVSMTWLYINCDLTHVSKGTGLDRLLKGANLPKSRLAGIGDTTGDLCIAQRVAHFACPSNAAAAIKEHAHYISPKPEAEGVVDILARLVG
jgi:hydroxymethylpyrimidine pyrophosphatase-like HAD family hydrolase